MTELIYREEAYAIIGAAMEVYNQLGYGFLESVYQESLEIELELRGIPFNSQQEFLLYYKERQLKKFFKPDLICYGKIIVDLKSIERFTSGDLAQMQNYLNGTRLELGLLINFGARNGLEYKRVILGRGRIQTNNDTIPH